MFKTRRCFITSITTLLISLVIIFLFLHEFSVMDLKARFYDPIPTNYKYTIRVNTFRRNDLLEKFLSHYVTCKDIEEITVVWSDQLNQPPMSLLHRFTDTSEPLGDIVKFEYHKTNSLNNRFLPLHEIKTPGVLSIDDDLIVDCESLTYAHGLWKSHSNALVGKLVIIVIMIILYSSIYSSIFFYVVIINTRSILHSLSILIIIILDIHYY